MEDLKQIDEATEDVKKMAVDFEALKAELEEQKKSMEAKMEDILKATANIDKAMTRSNDEEKEVGINYGFLSAKKDIAAGKNVNAPMWDDKTEKRFSEWLQMVAEKDYDSIKKAFGDNVHDASNWTPTEFRSELVRLQVQNSLALQKCRIVPMSRDKVEMPAPTGNYTAYWTSAGSAILDSKFTAGTVELDSAKLAAIALVNREDLEDPAYPVAQYAALLMAEDFGKKLDEEVFQGDDSDTTNHQFDGWEYAASVNEVTGSVDASPTFAELITEDNLLSVVGKLDDRELAGAEWFMTNAAWNTIRALEDGASSKIVRLNEAYTYDLLGFPVNRRSEIASATATADRAALFFGNPQWIFIGDRMGLRIDRSDEYRFANDQVVFRGLQRVAVKVALPSALVRLMFGSAA